MNVDVLAVAAHPDDIEITSGGFLLKMKEQGYTTGAIDFVRGEFGSNGTMDERMQEAEEAARILRVDVRKNLALPDGHLSSYPHEEMKEMLVKEIRALRPKVLIIPNKRFRHPDHGVASRVGHDAYFYSGVKKYLPEVPAYRPKLLLQARYTYEMKPSFIVDVTDVAEQKLAAIKAYRSQLFSFDEGRTETPLARKDFIGRVTAFMRYYGQLAGVMYGEPYLMDLPQYPCIDDPIASFRL